MNYVVHVLVLICLYALLSIALNLLAGYSGLLSLSQAALFGLGAYGVAVGTTMLHWQFAAAAVLGVVASLAGGVLLIPSALRLRGDYFAVATLSIQLFISSIFKNWTAVTNGAMGMSNIPRPSIFGYVIASEAQNVFSDILLAASTLALCWLLVSSPYGRVLRAMSQDQILAESFGKDVRRFKAQVIVLSALISGCAGVMYAGYVTFIDPSSFTVDESIFILAMIIIGGLGSLWGSLIGATVLTVLPEALRVVGMSSSVVGNVRQILFGTALVIMCIWRPQGIMGENVFLTRAEDPNAR